MIWVLVGLASACLAAIAMSSTQTRETVELTFPPDLEVAQVEAVLGMIAGLPRRSRVAIVLHGAAWQLTTYLTATTADLAAIRSALEGIAPSVRLGDVSPDRHAPARLRAFVGWRGSYILLRRDQPELAAAALLSSIRTAEADEQVRLTFSLRPLVRPKAPPLPRSSESRDWLSQLLTSSSRLPRDQVRAIRQQYAGPLLGARMRVDVWAPSKARAQQLLNGVTAVLRARSGARGRFSIRKGRLAWAGVGFMAAPGDLAPLLGWPLGGPSIASLRFNRSPQLLPDPTIPSAGSGRSFGLSTWPGLEQRPLIQPPVGATSHSLILGPTGSGKSALLTRLAFQDLETGHGLLLLDMKGDTANDLLERIPASRRGDVIVLDPADDRPLPGLKALDANNPDLTADLWVGVLRNLFHDSWGLRSERYIRLGVQTLALERGHALTELPRLFYDAEFRRQLLSAGDDPSLRTSWQAFEALSPAQQAEHSAPALGKVQDLVGRRLIRAVIGQAAPRINLREAIRNGRIVVVRLAPGLIGQPTAQLLGALIVYEAYQAVLSRQGLPEGERRPFGIYIDEPAVLGSLPVPLDSLFELARGLGVGLTLAAQSLTQLPESVRKAALTNAATIASFQGGADDAALVAKELVGVTAEQLQNLEQYTVALRMGLTHGLKAPVTTARTLPPLRRTSNANTIRDASARRYGQTIADSSRQPEPPSTQAPIGRRRRRAS